MSFFVFTSTLIHFLSNINKNENYVQSLDSDVSEFSGILIIEDGKLTEKEITVLHSRSIAEDIIFKNGNDLFSGELNF